MLQRRQQHDAAQAFVEWQLCVAAKHNLRSLGARLAEQTRLNALKLCFGAWREECEQQQTTQASEDGCMSVAALEGAPVLLKEKKRQVYAFQRS